MIKFSTKQPNGKTGIGLGLSAENIRLLKEGKPILIELGEMGLNAKIMIIYGETESDIIQTLKPFIGEETIMHGTEG